jgi:transposase-like protein
MPAPSVLTAPYRLLLADATTEDFFEDDLMSMDLELTERIGCSRYDRSRDRVALRNGYYGRDLVMGFGILESLRVPRCRSGACRPTLLERYRCRTAHVDRVVRSLFFAGVSTRSVGEVLQVLMVYEPSAAGVSRIVKQLDLEVAVWHNRPLSDRYVYLFLDGITMTLKAAPAAVRRMVLVAYGITADGRRELLDYHVAPSESSTEWERFLTSMMNRGLKGENLQLIPTDGGTGLRAAIFNVHTVGYDGRGPNDSVSTRSRQ